MPELTEITIPKIEADPFDAAFAEFSMPEGTAAPEAKPVEAEAPAPEPVAPPEETAKVEEVAPPAEEPTQPPAETDEALLARLANLVQKSAPKTEAAPTPAQTPAAQPAEERPAYSTEEQEFLQGYESEWADVSKAEALKRRAEYDRLVSYMFNEVATVVRPMEQALQQLLQRAQLAELQLAVPEYPDVRDGVAAWAEKQPAYLRAAYQHVIQHGTTEEVADLVGRYKRETGVTQAPVPQQKAVTELPTSAKQAAATLAPVSSRRSAVAAVEPDKNDFEGAFKRFAAAS